MQPPPTIAEAARQIAGKQLSPVELTRTCLDRIARIDPNLHSFLLVTEERALADGRAAEARIMRDGPKGPLDGIPIGYKDIYNTAGIRTTGHSRLLADNVPRTDAAVVARLVEAGTVMLGKLATHEFAMGGHAFDLPWPQPNNPWHLDHTTSGSSSGTAAAVAAGLISRWHWLGDRRLDLRPLRVVRCHGDQADLRTGQPRRYSAACFYTRSSRADGLDGGRLRHPAAGHGGTRPSDPASADRPVPDFRAKLGQGVRRGLRVGVVRHFFETADPCECGDPKGH